MSLKTTLILPALVGAALSAEAARAEDGAYIAARGGPAWAQSYTDTLVSITPARAGDIRLHNRTGTQGDLAVGYAVGKLSVEVEGSQKQARTGRLTGAADAVAAQVWASRSRVRSLMANAVVSVPLRNPGATGGVHLFGGAGLGHAWIRQTGTVTAQAISRDNSSGGKSFAWQAMAGVRYDIAPSLALDARYRHFTAARALSPFSRSYRDGQRWQGLLIGASYAF